MKLTELLQRKLGQGSGKLVLPSGAHLLLLALMQISTLASPRVSRKTAKQHWLGVLPPVANENKILTALTDLI